jgi:hypothetical protein
MLDESSLLKTRSNFYYVEKEAIPFEPVLLSVNDHGTIEEHCCNDFVQDSK